MKNCWRNSRANMSHRIRPWKSVEPPGVNGRISLTGFAGHVSTGCARAALGIPSAAKYLTTSLRFTRVRV